MFRAFGPKRSTLDNLHDDGIVNVAILGCGYVAEFYGTTLPNYPELKFLGGYDLDSLKQSTYLRMFPGRGYSSLDDLLADPAVEMVLNLTNPRAHFETTRRCLLAGKHVYSEKPLAMNTAEATQLAALAREKGLSLASAPCSVLSETAQTLGKALRDGLIGKVRLVYANFDDGMIAPHQAPWIWSNAYGAHFPAKDEFEVGCTYEHAGYVLTWLAAFFGPARRITSFASCQIPDKGIPVESMAPDFTVGCIEYDENVVARVTCGLVAPLDKSLTIIGDKGVLAVNNVRQDAGAVWLRLHAETGWRGRLVREANRIQRQLDRWFPSLPWRGREWDWPRRLPLVSRPSGKFVSSGKPVDFCRGPAEMAAAIREGRLCKLTPELGVHVVELVEALQYPERFGGRKQTVTTFAADAMAPERV
jgi:predicted dehydrogenase